METFVPTEFRAWAIISPPGKPIEVPVETMAEAIAAINTMVAIRENLSERFNLGWEDDVSGLEYKDSDGDWVDFHDIEGEEFDYYYTNWEEIHMQNPQKVHKPLTQYVER